MDRSQLLALAKQRGFTGYSKLNKFQLNRLLETGSHPPPPPKHWYDVIADGIGVTLDKLFTPFDHMSKYSVSEEPVPEGYIIRGANLSGMFDSCYIPDKEVQYEDTEYQGTDEEDDEDYEPVTVMKTVKIPGGWLIAHHHHPMYKSIISSLRAKSMSN